MGSPFHRRPLSGAGGKHIHLQPGIAGDQGQNVVSMGHAERTEEGWCLAELLRKKAELLLLRAPMAVADGEECFRQALDVARRQDVLSWELRVATSLARLWHAQSRAEPARELLAPLYGRFTEGFDTADLRAARALLDSSE